MIPLYFIFRRVNDIKLPKSSQIWQFYFDTYMKNVLKIVKICILMYLLYFKIPFIIQFGKMPNVSTKLNFINNKCGNFKGHD